MKSLLVRFYINLSTTKLMSQTLTPVEGDVNGTENTQTNSDEYHDLKNSLRDIE